MEAATIKPTADDRIAYIFAHYPHKLIWQCMSIFVDERTRNELESKIKQSIFPDRVAMIAGPTLRAFSQFEADALKKVLDIMVLLRKMRS